jgi:hypothetical protein
MYFFERAYVDYATAVRRFLAALFSRCGAIWQWFWSGPGSRIFELILRICVVITAVGLAVSFVRYENQHGRGFSASMLGVFALIVFCAGVVLWGWKALVHFVARIISGSIAAGFVMLLALAAVLIASAAFSVYLVALLILTLLSFLIFVPLRAGQEIWLLYRKIGYHCPYGDCHGTGLPIHLCPSCGQDYKDLMPSFYGLRYHVCRHPDGSEQKLPTMDMLGRSKLPRLCNGCGRPLTHSEIGEAAEWPLIIAGGPSAGKTVYVVQLIAALTNRLRQLNGTLQLGPRQLEFDPLLLGLGNGRLPAKTAGGVAEAWAAAVRIPKGPGRKNPARVLLYLFDNPGEVFGSMQQLGQMHALQHLRGIILLVDPFSLPRLSGHSTPDVKASEMPLLTVVGNLIRASKEYLRVQHDEKSRVPVAVVLTKVDALPVQEFPSLANLLPGHGSPDPANLQARCRIAIRELGGAPALDALGLNFEQVRCFACTSLGRTPDRSGRSFESVGVLDPLQWVIDPSDTLGLSDRQGAFGAAKI